MNHTLLLILDGYGKAPDGRGNAVSLASTPTLDRIFSLPEASTLSASGRDVGLPAGFMGNSEVGHLNIGAGRVVFQDMTRIDIAVENGELGREDVFQRAYAALKKTGGRLHLMGLLSDGGVHSHIRHVDAILQAAAENGVPVRLHAFMDGRDTEPTSGAGFIRDVLAMIENANSKAPAPRIVRLASLCGRFYAMDRDKRWERVQTAWEMLVHGQAETAPDPEKALLQAYEQGETDEFLKPRLVESPDEACVRDGDAVFFFNFRADRARELVSAFLPGPFDGFDRGRIPQLADPCGIFSMTAYDARFTFPVVIVKKAPEQTLGEVVSEQGFAQLRIAETEKYAHVTYFFNGGKEDPNPGEDRILVPSPKDIPTYDLKPQMSAEEVTDKLIQAWDRYPFMVCNLANADMVGHTGIIEAAVQAVETVDRCVERILNAAQKTSASILITADHGNAEEMLTPEGHAQTAHTTNPVPVAVLRSIDGTWKALPLRSGGKLADIAPTLLQLMDIAQPQEMTGSSLLA
ncbi:MAG: 2,3-bisphosphoglycerate-independent phosphoglycerate mutase [Desulfovibrionaceae bacterium]|nr:2,3-bisphosphoglycerate-independent phosphoglycerate mutase [Desulfovibrionaceae bacterium]